MAVEARPSGGRRRRSRAPVLLGVGLALFVAAMGYLVASSLADRSEPTFEPAPVGVARPRRAGADTVTDTLTDTLTVDASDERAWRFVDLDRGAVLLPPDTAGWDLAVRRFHVIAADAAADLGAVAFDTVSRAPRRGYVANALGTDTTNAALRRWYHYGALTHLLTPLRRVYVVRSRAGGYAKLQVLSYYCTGMRPGCLTLRYARLRTED